MILIDLSGDSSSFNLDDLGDLFGNRVRLFSFLNQIVFRPLFVLRRVWRGQRLLSFDPKQEFELDGRHQILRPNVLKGADQRYEPKTRNCFIAPDQTCLLLSWRFSSLALPSQGRRERHLLLLGGDRGWGQAGQHHRRRRRRKAVRHSRVQVSNFDYWTSGSISIVICFVQPCRWCLYSSPEGRQLLWSCQ